MNELDFPKALLLGLIQGLTEFLPVSSSGHLVIIQQLFGLKGDAPGMLLFDIATHVGTLLAVMVVFAATFRRFLVKLVSEFKSPLAGRKTALLVTWLGVVACVPTAAIGLGFKDSFEEAFDSPATAGVGLLLTGTLLFVTGLLPRPRRGWRRMGWWRAGLIGLAQGCAILPGISRSGSTICTAMAVGVKRRWAAEFSFFIVVPPIIGAAAIKLRETMSLPADQLQSIPWGPIVIGSLVAFISGVLALRILLTIIIRDKLHHFCYYCWVLGIGVLAWTLL